MNAPAAMIFLAFGFGLGIVVCMALAWWEDRPNRRADSGGDPRVLLMARPFLPPPRPMSRERARAVSLLQEEQERKAVDAAIRTQSKLHGRAHVHVGDRRASLERT